MGLGHHGCETRGGGSTSPRLTSHPPSLHPPVEVLACQQYQILPRMAEFIQVTLTPDVWNKEKEFLADQMLVFSSEQTEDHLPLHELSIYFQVIQVNQDGQAQLLYRNNTRKTVFISPKDVVAHAEIMLSAGVAQMEQCAETDP